MFFFACSREETHDILWDEVDVPLSLNTMPLGGDDPDTRLLGDVEIDEGIGDDYYIHDFWLFQFDADGNRVGTAKYYEVTEGEFDRETGAVNTIVSIISGQNMQYYVVANTYDRDFAINSSSVSEISRAYSSIESLDDLYVLIRDGEGNSTGKGALMMSGVAKYDMSGTFACELYRNVAKVVLTISNDRLKSGVELLSAQLKNVPMAVYYFDMIHSADENFPLPADIGYGDFPKVNLDAAGNQDFIFYLPRNRRKALSVGLIPEHSTYIELLGRYENKDIRYRFHFTTGGQNYDVLPNHLYHFNIDIEDVGDFDADNRVDDLSVNLLPESNCYLINPSSVTFKVPLTRINRFWSAESPYMSNNPSYDGENALTASDEWVVEIIWQDVQDKVIEFVSSEGQGNNSFSFRTTAAAEGRTSNVVVGLRKKNGSGYLWSWHLWITPYSPYESSDWTWKEGVYIYPVTGGAVHRYQGREATGVWNTLYWGKFIMDRNLGAGSADRSGGSSAYGMYYQFGRKDPFPRGGVNAVVYDASGVKKTIRYKAGQDYVSSSVLAPDMFIGHQTISDWVIADDKSLVEDKVWNDNSLPGSSNSKSIFDPCPPGWKMPKIGTFKMMILNGKPNVPEEQLNTGRGFQYGYDFYVSDNLDATAYFPLTGYLIRNGGSLYRAQDGKTGHVHGYIYYDTQMSYSQGNEFSYRYDNQKSSEILAAQGAVTKNVAYPVRCVQE